MFGKTKDATGDSFDEPDIDDFFGDERAADHDAQLDNLRYRVKSVESQINSQFTSMAAYAQIAQEQIELARAESRAEIERTEGRLTELLERERADRLQGGSATTGIGAPAPSFDARLTSLEEAVETIKVGINDCLSRQKALADAITALFEPKQSALPPPVADGPIGGLAMHD